jgi:hypothetical protein
MVFLGLWNKSPCRIRVAIALLLLSLTNSVTENILFEFDPNLIGDG